MCMFETYAIFGFEMLGRSSFDSFSNCCFLARNFLIDQVLYVLHHFTDFIVSVLFAILYDETTYFIYS